MASQSVPNCKQKKKRIQKNTGKQKSHIKACDFCLLLFNQGIVCDDNVSVFFN